MHASNDVASGLAASRSTDRTVPSPSQPTDAPRIDRGFLRIREGQIHYRTAGAGDARPLWMIRASPASSTTLVPLARELARRSSACRRCRSRMRRIC